MQVRRIYTENSLSDRERLEISGQAGQHIARVLRMRVGEELVLFDGSGGEHRARIESIQGNNIFLARLGFDPVEREAPVKVTLLQAISRGERMDWTIQKATEMGVHRILPLGSQRSMVKLTAERAERRREHWQAVAISACEQCGRNRVPEVATPLSLEQALAQVSSYPLKLCLREDAQTRPADLPDAPAQVCIAIGPEGGLDECELRILEGAGFLGLRLGPRILRTETAGLAAMAALLCRWGDF
ncbi:MAG: 16S rRNA (uracil(1498)-N(3))-methyltransferase [Gammaproteobacteria bacterium]|nr:16S rRNA (uracil(1498)-N(3))-methyltransferase [Gammaproteobacteria bacterium]